MIKIAFITDDDGKTISRHFGRAAQYLVVTVENGKPEQREIRPKMGHAHFSDQPHDEHHGQERHGFDQVSQNRHNQMAVAIQDCEALICGGMGAGAYESMKSLNIRPLVTDMIQVEDALQAYLSGKLQDRVDMLH